MTEQQPIPCRVGSGTDHPCPNPAAERLLDAYWVCEGHKLAFELGEEEDGLEKSLEYLGRWIRSADRHNIAPLRKELRALREGFAAELAEIETKQREISERYSLPPSWAEQHEAEQHDETPVHEPRSEEERRFLECDRRASRFVAAASNLEAEIDKLQARLEAEVLPLLEEEAEKAEEEAQRMREEFEL